MKPTPKIESSPAVLEEEQTKTPPPIKKWKAPVLPTHSPSPKKTSPKKGTSPSKKKRRVIEESEDEGEGEQPNLDSDSEGSFGSPSKKKAIPKEEDLPDDNMVESNEDSLADHVDLALVKKGKQP